MSKIFVKKNELELVNGGYLVTGEKEIPVCNQEFIAAQKKAEWVITFAEKAKGKDFDGKAPASLEDVRREVVDALLKSNVEYIPAPKKVKTDTIDKLQKEALSFVNFVEESNKVEKINDFLQQFNIIKEFEEFGLYFEENICKLNKIYTVEDITKAVTEVIDLVD